MSPSAHVCPKCGAALPSNATEGLCPRCLFAQLEDPVPPEGVDSETEGANAGPASIEGGSEREFGDYELFEEIGEGGMGVVYRARQVSLNRPVAVKVIKPGMDTRKIIARFEAERQALALMDHPGIARVFDAGATQTGRPYFVMELVRGVRFTDYCEQHQLSTNERLDLFIQVCQAVQHAHQKGIIHRDLKPSNILVTELDGRPLPKIIDFGIAKATEGRLAEETLLTVAGQFIGTPAYLSPEQAEWGGVDIDTRSDIYSLGVLLYELLTGCLPFEPKTLAKAGLEEMRRTIREVTPVRPSTRLRQTGSVSDPASSPVTHHLPLATDLDWIAMKCLEKDRARRYETANGLAEDLQRHLHNEPVLARPPSRLYEFQKTVRRHKIGFAATSTVILVLIAGVLVSTWQAARANRAERKAQEEELTARRRAYASDMQVAENDLTKDHWGGAAELLEGQRPEPGQQDLRGWEWRYLWRQSRSDALFTLGQVPGQVSSLAVSADGHWLAVGVNHRGGLSLWDLRMRKESTNLVQNEEGIRAAFSPTEPLLAFTSINLLSNWTQQSTLHVWNTATRKMVCRIQLTNECAGLAFSEDGRTLVTSTQITSTQAGHTNAGHITLWRVTAEGKLEELRSYPSGQSLFEAATQFAATPDLSLAAYTYSPPGQRAKRIRVVDLHSGREIWSAKAAQFLVSALCFSRDGKTLASASGFGKEEAAITLRETASGKVIKQISGLKHMAFSMLFWPDGTKLASVSSGDQAIRIWDVASRKCVDVLRDHSLHRRLAILPDGKTLVSGGGKDGTIRFWDISTTHSRPPHVTIPEKVLTWSFTSDSRSVVTLTKDGQVDRWTGPDFQQKQPLLKIGSNFTISAHYQPFSEDGRFLAIGSTTGLLRVWDVSQRVLRCQWTNTTGLVVPLGFRSKGNELFTWSETDKLVHKWNLATGQQIRMKVPPWPVVGAVSPDGQLAIMADEAGNVWRLDPSSDNQQRLTPAVLEASDVAFSRGGERVAISSITGVTRVWDTATWNLQATNLYGEFSVAFSPDGKRLATGGGGDKALKLWDTESWKNEITLEGQNDGFSQMAFSADDNVIGSLNITGTLYLWRAPSWEEIAAAEKAEDEGPHGQQAKAR